MKYALIFFASLFLGYFLYPTLNPVPKDKFQTFIQNEARKFAEATDAEAKLRAAEEMYGKMMMIFLAELGLKTSISSKPVEFAKVEPEVVCPEPVVCPIAETVPDISVDQSLAKKMETKKKLSPEQEGWRKYSSTPFLDLIKGKDQRILGRFEGILRRQKGRVDSIVMLFDLVQEKNQITGETIISMTDPEGKEYSRNAGKGGNRSIKKADENAFYIEASPSSYFILYFKHYPQISGKYFEKEKFIGNVQLRKVGL